MPLWIACLPACAHLQPQQEPGVELGAAYRFLSRFTLEPGARGGLSLKQKQMHLSTLK